MASAMTPACFALKEPTPPLSSFSFGPPSATSSLGAQPVFAPSGVAGALAPAAGAGVAFAASAGGAAGCAPSPVGATTLPLFQEAMMISVARVDSAPPGSQRFNLSSLPEAIASEYSRHVG